MTAELKPPSTWQRAQQSGLTWYQRQVYYSTPWLPASPDNNIGFQPRWRAMQEVIDGAVGVEARRNIRVDIPFEVYGFTATATPSDGSALPNNLHPLDTFRVLLTSNTNDRLVTEAVIARTIMGTAERPSHVGGTGWSFDRGGTIQIGITPIRANLIISLVAWGVEVRGPTNIARP
jgi:hypothetical protein